jgi:cytochrome c2
MKIIVCAVFAIGALSGLLSGQSPSPAGKTAGEAFKNVVILRDTPQPQFLSAMQVISGSLGVQCTYCHAQPFDSDTKPAKVTARNMIKMTLEINAKNFGGKQVVSCNTCHQGSTHAGGSPALWDKTPQQLAEFKRQQQFTAAPANSAAAEVLPTVDQILASYRKAVGGDQAKSLHLEGFVTTDLNSRPRPIDTYAAFPDQLLFGITNAGIQSKLLINADHAWAISPQGVQDMPMEQAHQVMDLFQPVKFISSDATREVTGLEQVDGRPCFRVVSTDARAVNRLYFDQQNGLLHKVRTEYPTPLGPELVETILDDYADVAGIKMPFSIVHSALTDRVVYRFSKIEANVAVDRAKFEPPPAKK